MSTQHDPIIDLTRRHFTRVRGDITVIGTWSLSNGRPVLALIPSRLKPTHERVTPCLVPIDMAYLWDEHTGDATHCATTSAMFAQALGMNPYQPREVIQLTSIVREHLGDLLAMPAMPATEERVIADIIKTEHDTGRTSEAEIVSDV